MAINSKIRRNLLDCKGFLCKKAIYCRLKHI